MTATSGDRATALMERYAPFLPVGPTRRPALTLGEGSTPLVHARRLGRRHRPRRTCTSRSRARTRPARSRTAAWSWPSPRPLEAGAPAIVCASTGNTSASAAAYGAAAGLEVIVVLPKGQIAAGKLLQALVAGARVVAIDGNFDQALGIVRALAEQDDHPVTLVNSVNPFRLEGQKTAAFEICDDLGRAPDVLAIPVGNAGNISAYWAGFRDYAAAGLVDAHAPDVGLPGRRRRAARASATGSTTRRPWRPRSGSATRRRGPRRSMRATSRAAGSRRSPTTRSSPPTATLARLRGHLLRARLGGQRRRDRAGCGGRRARPRGDRRVRPHRPRPEGPDDAPSARCRRSLEADADGRSCRPWRWAGRTMDDRIGSPSSTGDRVARGGPGLVREPRRGLRLPRRSPWH